MMTGTSAFAETRHRDETKATERSFNDRNDNRERFEHPERSSGTTSNSTYRINDRSVSSVTKTFTAKRHNSTYQRSNVQQQQQSQLQQRSYGNNARVERAAASRTAAT
jgi:hypothetical protein